MAEINRIANVQIALQTAGISEQGFGTPMILAPEFNADNRVLTYTGVDQVLEDGAKTDSDVYRALTDAFSQSPRSREVKVGQIVASETVTDALAACNDADKEWYGLAAVTRDKQNVMDIAEWTEAHIKLFGTSTNDPNALLQASDEDILYLMKNNNFYRSFGYYHADASNDYPEIAVMTRCFSILPGGETWANKRLAGVTTDRLTETQARNVHNKNGNTFESFRNLSITQKGKVAAGEWIDIIRFRDWLQEDMQNRLFLTFINNDKISFTDDDIRLIEKDMRSSLQLGQKRKGISLTEYDEDDKPIPGFTVWVPLSSSVPFNDKANRVLNDAGFSANLQGAIHVANIYGTLTYNAS